jgi:hypothetical protein
MFDIDDPLYQTTYKKPQETSEAGYAQYDVKEAYERALQL